MRIKIRCNYTNQANTKDDLLLDVNEIVTLRMIMMKIKLIKMTMTMNMMRIT